MSNSFARVPMIGKLNRLRAALAAAMVIGVLALVAVWTMGVAFATHPGGDHLVAFGPTNPQTHLPEWYEDSTGLRLKLCIDDPVLCIAEPVDPANPYSVETGFGAEAFWFAAEALMPVGTGGDARLVTAIEAAYAFEIPEPGGQQSFGRIRVRADELQPSTAYTVTHPYGVDVVVTDDEGDLRFTEDIGCLDAIPGAIACDFSKALLSRVGPFLVWDPAVAPAAPPGAIGNPEVEHPVIGSPFGTNFFRIEGPNVGGVGVNIAETSNFIVQGKLFDNPPTAVNDTANVPEGADERPIDVLANDSDMDGDTVLVTGVTQPASGSVAIAPGGTHVLFTPGAAGSAVFTYTVSSTMPGNDPKTNTATVTVNVHADNAAPVAVNDLAQALPNSLNNRIAILANDTDADGDALDVPSVIQPANGSVTIEPLTNVAVYQPNAAFAGTDVFTYTLSDGLASASGTVTVTVDTAPVATNDTVRVGINSVNNSIDVLANDTDADGHALQVTAVSTPFFGTAAVGPFGGSVTYTPPPGFQGGEAFTYTVSDNVLTATATVNVFVEPNKIYLPIIGR